jgi:hypothetical protein
MRLSKRLVAVRPALHFDIGGYDQGASPRDFRARCPGDAGNEPEPAGCGAFGTKKAFEVSHKARADYGTERPRGKRVSSPSVQDCYHCVNRCLDMWNDSVDHTAGSSLLQMADTWMQLASESDDQPRAEQQGRDANPTRLAAAQRLSASQWGVGRDATRRGAAWRGSYARPILPAQPDARKPWTSGVSDLLLVSGALSGV